MRGLNKWNFVTLSPIDHQYVPDEVNAIYEEIIIRPAMEACRDIHENDFGAIDTDNQDACEGYYLAQ